MNASEAQSVRLLTFYIILPLTYTMTVCICMLVPSPWCNKINKRCRGQDSTQGRALAVGVYDQSAGIHFLDKTFVTLGWIILLTVCKAAIKTNNLDFESFKMRNVFPTAPMSSSIKGKGGP